MDQPREEMAAVEARDAARRIVLLDAAGQVVQTLATPPARQVHAELRRLAAEHPGQVVAAEWLRGDGLWVRWLTTLINDMKRGVCKSCGADLLWVKTASGKAMPLDDLPVLGGNVQLSEDGTRATVLSKAETQRQRDLGTPQHRSHHATCPAAASWRKATR